MANNQRISLRTENWSILNGSCCHFNNDLRQAKEIQSQTTIYNLKDYNNVADVYKSSLFRGITTRVIICSKISEKDQFAIQLVLVQHFLLQFQPNFGFTWSIHHGQYLVRSCFLTSSRGPGATSLTRSSSPCTSQ